jgi:hypothetical protein
MALFEGDLADYQLVVNGYGGYNQDHEFFGNRPFI